MYDELAAAGGEVEMWKVGHSLIKARMKETGAQLAGEMSGHMFFAHRWLGFDDAIYAGARLLELLSRGERTLAERADELPVMINTPELRIDCPDDKKFAVVARGHRAAARGSAGAQASSTSTACARSSTAAGAWCARRTRSRRSSCAARRDDRAAARGDPAAIEAHLDAARRA